jgi:hypothetical protein
MARPTATARLGVLNVDDGKKMAHSRGRRQPARKEDVWVAAVAHRRQWEQHGLAASSNDVSSYAKRTGRAVSCDRRGLCGRVVHLPGRAAMAFGPGVVGAGVAFIPALGTGGCCPQWPIRVLHVAIEPLPGGPHRAAFFSIFENCWKLISAQENYLGNE